MDCRKRSSRSAKTLRDPAVEVPNPRQSLKISKLQRMASAILGIETLGFPWDLVLGVWDFHCEFPPSVFPQQRSTSATLQAWAMHPPAWWGSRASNTSLIVPTALSFM